MKKDVNRIVNFFFEIASLRRITRAHCQIIKGVTENIADHSFRVAVIGMLLAEMEKADNNKVLKMCLFHDLPEARTGDANFINQQYVDMREDEALKDQMNGLPIGDEILKIIKEYEEQKSKESIIAKDADLLDQMILEREHFYKDSKNSKIWREHTEKKLKTKLAKKLAKQIKKSNPFEWLYQLAEDKTGKKIDR